MVPSGWLLGTESQKITIAGEDERRVEAVGERRGVAGLRWETTQQLLKGSKTKLPCNAAPPILSEDPRDPKEAFAHRMASRDQEAAQPFLGWRDYRDVVCLGTGILFDRPEEGKLDSYYNLDEP